MLYFSIHDFAGIPFVFVIITFSASFDGYGTDRRFASHLIMIKKALLRFSRMRIDEKDCLTISTE